jgi:hypothetical protein
LSFQRFPDHILLGAFPAIEKLEEEILALMAELAKRKIESE